MNEQSYEYRTGQTQPAKSRSGIVAFLLICVIFLAGLVSLLGMMNIHLLSQLRQAGTETPLSFAEGDLSPTALEGNCLTVGGITVQELPELYQQLYDLPAGLYVVDAPEGSPVSPGDVLTAFGDTAIETLPTLQELQDACNIGQQIQLTFFRQDADYFIHTFIFGN